MAVELATKYLPYVDEQFTTESKTSLVTNQDFNWNGAHSVKVYKVTTGKMNDYDRTAEGYGVNGSRYGTVEGLQATTEELTLVKDRSFTFAIDTLDMDETAQNLASASALARQIREVIIPEVDSYVFSKIANGAGTVNTLKLTDKNVYDAILSATETLDSAEVPDGNRVLLVTPGTYTLMKKNTSILMETDLAQEARNKGVLGILDGAIVVKVPPNRLPVDTGFIMAHPSATVAPIKLESYKTHNNPPGINGDLVEGRICYDAFVLDNKAKAIYLHKNA